MQKKIWIIAVVVVIAAALVGYYYWKGDRAAAPKEAEEVAKSADVLTESSIQGTVPSLSANPLENKPQVNPAEKANPFSSVKTNPFE